MAQLFSLTDEGVLTYSEPVVKDGNLFGDELDPDLVQDDINAINGAAASTEELLPEDEILAGDEELIEEPLPVGDTIVYNVYAIPSDASGYPNANSLSYIEDVMKGYPLDFDYVAYRTDDQYAQSMILYVGEEATGSGSRIHFDECDVIELNYIYQNYNSSYLERNYYQDSNVDITLSANTLAYTNVLPGYATFDNTMEDSKFSVTFAAALIVVAASFILSRILGGIKHV